MGGLLAADKTIVCPVKGSGVAVSGANAGLDGIISDKGAVANIALAQVQGPNGTVHVEGTFDSTIVQGGQVATDTTPQTPA